MTKILTAYRRADGGIAGAAFLVLASACAFLAISQSDERIKIAVPALQQVQPRSIAQSPAELAAARMAEEHQCLAEALYFEARGEGEEGQKAVAEVILTRTQSRYYPNTICGVVHQGATSGSKFCQFSFACDGSLKKRKERMAWDRARQLAANILAGAVSLSGETENAIAYHTLDVTPVWAATMLKTAQIGNHIFYRRAPYSDQVATIQASVEMPQATHSASEASPAAAPPSDEVQPNVQVSDTVRDGA